MTPTAPSPRKRVKKVVASNGHHGGAWKVAYADFVTAMMALFMIMWLLASTDAKARKEISNYFRTGILPEGDMAMNHAAQVKPSVIEQSPIAGPQAEQSLEDAAKQIEEAIAQMASHDPDLKELSKYVTVRVTPDGVLIEVVDHDGGDDLLFDLASSTLKPALTKFLVNLAPILGKRTDPLEIQGNTDARPFVAGAGKTNWDLSYERASAARAILEGGGVRPDQVVGVVARGAAELYDPQNPTAAQNRRLSILLIHPRKAAADPGDKDSKMARADAPDPRPAEAAAAVAAAAHPPVAADRP